MQLRRIYGAGPLPHPSSHEHILIGRRVEKRAGAARLTQSVISKQTKIKSFAGALPAP